MGILGEVYQDIENNSCIFKIMVTSRKSPCACGYIAAHIDDNTTCLPLRVRAIHTVQVVSELLHMYFAPTMIEYRCDGCKQDGQFATTFVLENFPEILLIVLSIFDGYGEKLKPCLSIDQELYHIGLTKEYGHYTCAVKVNGIWHSINDTVICKSHPNLSCSLNDITVPYILMYKKKDVLNLENVGLSYSSPNQLQGHMGAEKQLNSHNKRIHNIIETDVEVAVKKSKLDDTQTPAQRMKKMRSKRSQEDKEKEKEKNRESRACTRANLSEADKEKEKEKDRESHAWTRANLSEADKEKEKEKDRERHAWRYANLSEADKEKEKEKDVLNLENIGLSYSSPNQLQGHMGAEKQLNSHNKRIHNIIETDVEVAV